MHISNIIAELVRTMGPTIYIRSNVVQSRGLQRLSDV